MFVVQPSLAVGPIFRRLAHHTDAMPMLFPTKKPARHLRRWAGVNNERYLCELEREQDLLEFSRIHTVKIACLCDTNNGYQFMGIAWMSNRNDIQHEICMPIRKSGSPFVPSNAIDDHRGRNFFEVEIFCLLLLSCQTTLYCTFARYSAPAGDCLHEQGGCGMISR